MKKPKKNRNTNCLPHVLIFRPQGRRFARPRLRIRRIRKKALGKNHRGGQRFAPIRRSRNPAQLERRPVRQPAPLLEKNFMTGELRRRTSGGVSVRNRFRHARRTRRLVRGKLRRFPMKPASVRRRGIGKMVRNGILARSGIRRHLRTDRFRKIGTPVPLRKAPFCL